MATTYLYIGSDARDFPADGHRPSLHVNPGDLVQISDPPSLDNLEQMPAQYFQAQ